MSNGAANRVVRALGIEPQEELRSARSAEELGSLVRTSEEQGALSSQTASMLARSLAFGDRTAGDVMTSRTQVVGLPRTASVRELLEVAISSGHSRFPIEGDGIDDIVGVVHVKQALAVPRGERGATPVDAVLGPVPRVPEAVHLDRLLVTLREPGLQMAVVVDEYGGTAGIVTLEDLVEELVGEVDDEHDAGSRPPVEQRPQRARPVRPAARRRGRGRLPACTCPRAPTTRSAASSCPGWAACRSAATPSSSTAGCSRSPSSTGAASTACSSSEPGVPAADGVAP